jgi:SAM-dependent methyltransferase
MNSLYDLIGSTYTMARRADSEITHELARIVGNEDGSRFLDLACGTGNYTSAIADTGGQWFGIDISEIMLKKAKERNHNIEWTVSRADSLPYQDRHFQGVICSLAILEGKEFKVVVDKTNEDQTLKLMLQIFLDLELGGQQLFSDQSLKSLIVLSNSPGRQFVNTYLKNLLSWQSPK